MRKNGYTTVELLIVIGIFTVLYITSTILISHAFKYDAIKEEYNSKISLMETQAKQYAEDHAGELFKDSNEAYIYANDLVKANYYAANEAGNIVDPRDTAKTLNDVKIELIKNDNEIEARAQT